MFRKILLMLFLCGLTGFSVLTNTAAVRRRMRVKSQECVCPKHRRRVRRSPVCMAKTDDRPRDATSRSVSSTMDRRHAVSMVFPSDVLRAMSR